MYVAMPNGRLRQDQNMMPAGSDAASAAGDSPVSRIRSTMCISDCVPALSISGTAIASSSAYPPGVADFRIGAADPAVTVAILCLSSTA